MTEDEHLLLCLAEECDEVGQRVMKALRFGLSEVQRDQPLNNAERIVDELEDLISVARILQRRAIIGEFLPSGARINAKRLKIERYMEIGRREGTITDPIPEAGQVVAGEERDG